jgi:hypothetical protein
MKYQIPSIGTLYLNGVEFLGFDWLAKTRITKRVKVEIRF